MVIDLRRYAPNDWVAQLSLISNNAVGEGGGGGFKILRRARTVKSGQNALVSLADIVSEKAEEQKSSISLVKQAKKLEGDQYDALNLFKYVGSAKSQKSFLTGLQMAQELSGEQIAFVVAFNIAGTVENQFSFFSLNNDAERAGSQLAVLGGVNQAKEIREDQILAVGLANLAREVGGNQMSLINLMNYAERVGGNQSGAAACIQTENENADQSFCFIRYNPTEGWGLGSSFRAKIRKAENYLNKMASKLEAPEYLILLENLQRETPTLRRKLTGHWAYTDIISRQARLRLKSIERAQESPE